jgi:predicted metal-dependent hydrolase
MTNIKDISLMYLNSLLVKFDKQLIYGPDIVSKTNFRPVWGSYNLETEISIRPVYAWNYLKVILAW